MDTLNELEFQCKKCRLIIKYKALAAHFDICSKQIHLCSLGCGDKKEMTLEQIKHHLLLACPNATYMCQTCSTEIYRKDVQSHDCIKALLAINDK